VPPSNFERQTIKYWCPVDELFAFMVNISKNLPVLLLNKDTKDLNQRIKDFNFEIPTPESTQEVNSI